MKPRGPQPPWAATWGRCSCGAECWVDIHANPHPTHKNTKQHKARVAAQIPRPDEDVSARPPGPAVASEDNRATELVELLRLRQRLRRGREARASRAVALPGGPSRPEAPPAPGGEIELDDPRIERAIEDATAQLRLDLQSLSALLEHEGVSLAPPPAARAADGTLDVRRIARWLNEARVVATRAHLLPPVLERALAAINMLYRTVGIDVDDPRTWPNSASKATASPEPGRSCHRCEGPAHEGPCPVAVSIDEAEESDDDAPLKRRGLHLSPLVAGADDPKIDWTVVRFVMSADAYRRLPEGVSNALERLWHNFFVPTPDGVVYRSLPYAAAAASTRRVRAVLRRASGWVEEDITDNYRFGWTQAPDDLDETMTVTIAHRADGARIAAIPAIGAANQIGHYKWGRYGWERVPLGLYDWERIPSPPAPPNAMQQALRAAGGREVTG